MLLELYLGISIITLIVFILTIKSLENQAINKYEDRFKQVDKMHKKDAAGQILSCLQMLIVSFVPILNIMLLLVVIFNYSDLRKEVFEKLEQEMKDNDIG